MVIEWVTNNDSRSGDEPTKRAAEYVRMSTEHQKYSTDNQAAEIRAYAARRGFEIGELRPGVAPVPLQLRVASTGSYDLNVTSANSGRQRPGSSDWYVPSRRAIGGHSVNLTGGGTTTRGTNS